MSIDTSPLLSRKEVARFLKVTHRTVARWEAAGAIKPIRWSSRAIRYDQRDVDRLVTQGRLLPQEVKCVFVVDHLYVLRGTEQDGESWHVARPDHRAASPRVEQLAQAPFACRSLAFDGSRF